MYKQLKNFYEKYIDSMSGFTLWYIFPKVNALLRYK